ncbi:MAG: hypothetical protein Q8M86_06030 [Syntrophales bacterium]|nr:hypothetical protein [Syntrophales bacterium]MDP3097485.1 hypothetical protein [Syntrophales bacterium]
MNAATISPIALPGTGAKRFASPTAALLEPLRFIDASVREVPEAEETTS